MIQALQTAAPLASRAVELPFDSVSVPPSAPGMIETVARARLDAFVADTGTGGIGALYLKDLATGEELAINADIALSAQAWLRWAVALEIARVADSVDGPATRALLQNGPEFNLALGQIGNGDSQSGADQVSMLLRELGLTSSFLAQPPGAAQRPPVIVTPANARGDISTNPDPVAQSTAAETGLLLEIIDSCQRNTGALILNYPGLFTPAKCGALLDAFGANPGQGLIDAASPEAVVIQRQNWTENLHASAALVRAQGRSYVIVIALSAPGALDWQRTSPVITDIARAAHAALTGRGAPAVAPLMAAPAR